MLINVRNAMLYGRKMWSVLDDVEIRRDVCKEHGGVNVEWRCERFANK